MRKLKIRSERCRVPQLPILWRKQPSRLPRARCERRPRCSHPQHHPWADSVLAASPGIWQQDRMRLGPIPPESIFWKWSNGVKVSEMGIFWCISITNNVKSCRKFNEKAQTVNFSVFTMCGRELPAEKTYFWWKLGKRKHIFLNVFH